MALDWEGIAKIVGPSVGFLLVVYWQRLDNKETMKQLFLAVKVLEKYAYVLERLERRIK